MAPQFVLVRGLPGAGKTTWARKWVEENSTGRARVNRDDLRKLMFDAYVLTHEQENAVTTAQQSAVKALLAAGRDVVVDDTNLSAKTVKGWYKVAFETGAEVLFMDIDTDVEECVRRNAVREKAVDEDVIRRFASRYLTKGKLPEPPSPDFPTAPRPYVPDMSKPRAWLVDVDGTLAHMSGRSPYEWHRVGEDTLSESVARVVQIIASHEPDDDNHPDAVIIMSGRDGSCRPQTEKWLKRHDIQYDELFMRPAGDMRKDSIVKLELFDQNIRDRYWVQGVFDDRDQVVAMWRSLGLVALQVAPGSF